MMSRVNLHYCHNPAQIYSHALAQIQVSALSIESGCNDHQQAPACGVTGFDGAPERSLPSRP